MADQGFLKRESFGDLRDLIDHGKFYGLITRIDVLNYLRHKAH